MRYPLVLIMLIVVLVGSTARTTTVPTTTAVTVAEPTDEQRTRAASVEAFLASQGSTLEDAVGQVRTTLGLASRTQATHGLDCRGPSSAAEGGAVLGADRMAVDATQLDTVLAWLHANGPAELATAVDEIESTGGGIRLERGDELDADTLALSVGDQLVVGHDWLRAALVQPSSVYSNLAHEVLGHMTYRTPLSCLLLEAAAAGTPLMSDPDAYREAYLRFVYPEAEIFAELQELRYLSDNSLGDDPYLDIVIKRHQLEQVYPAEVADLVLAWLRLRCEQDPTLQGEPRFYCLAALGPASE